MDRVYVGLAQWTVLRELCDRPGGETSIAVVSAAVRPLIGGNRPRAVVDSLLATGLVRHACPPVDHEMTRWCLIAITERGEGARLDKRGRRRLGYGR